MPNGFWCWVVLGGAVALVWWARLIALGPVLRRRCILRDTPGTPPTTRVPRVSVVVAANDEEENLEACVTGLIAQDYPDFEVIVVDDRSTDRTPSILARLEKEYAGRLRAVTVRHLPPGWFGKCHAMQEGVAGADGDWFLFTDADCRFTSRRTLALAVQEAASRSCDFLTVIPSLDALTVWERILQPVCALVLIFWFQPDRVNNPNRRTAYANGAFMLMSRRCYEAIGGHAAARSQLNEDICFAQLAKARGQRLRMVENDGLYRTRMYASFSQAWQGWSRILSGALAHPLRIMTSATLVLLLAIVPWVSLGAALLLGESWRGPWALAAGVWGVAVLGEQLALSRLYATMGLRRGWSLGYALGAIVVLGMLFNALLKALGITRTTWRRTTYRSRSAVSPAPTVDSLPDTVTSA